MKRDIKSPEEQAFTSRQISELSAACPQCGAPFKAEYLSEMTSPEVIAEGTRSLHKQIEKHLLEEHGVKTNVVSPRG